jgi:hypothetical protein
MEVILTLFGFQDGNWVQLGEALNVYTNPDNYSPIYPSDIDMNDDGDKVYVSTANNVFGYELRAPSLPILSMESDLEVLVGESLQLDATVTDGVPSVFQYQWYFNGFAFPSNFGGTDGSFTIDGIFSNEGEWKLEVTNEAGTTTHFFNVDVVEDSDLDGIYDYKETNTGIYISENDTGTNPFSNDTDGDGFTDDAELDTHNTDPNKADTDGDGLSDKVEVDDLSSNPNSIDSDADGFPDNVEYYLSGFDINSDSSSLSYSGAGLIEQSAYDAVMTERDAAIAAQANAETSRDSAIAERDARPTQASYDALVAENSEKYNLKDIADLREGSKMIEISNGEATISMEVEKSDELGSWTVEGN